MQFSTRSYIKLILVLFLTIGVILLSIVFINFINAPQEPSLPGIIGFSLLVLSCFVLPYYTFKNFEIISNLDGVWKVKYPNKKIEVIINKSNLQQIIIMVDNFSLSHLPKHTQIKIKLNNSPYIFLNSLETSDFKQLILLLENDFDVFIKRDKYI